MFLELCLEVGSISMNAWLALDPAVPWLFCTIPALQAPEEMQEGGFYCWLLPCQSLRPNLVKVCAVQFLNVVWEQHEN